MSLLGVLRFWEHPELLNRTALSTLCCRQQMGFVHLHSNRRNTSQLLTTAEQGNQVKSNDTDGYLTHVFTDSVSLMTME